MTLEDELIEPDAASERIDFGEEVHCPVCNERADFAVSFNAENPPLGGKFELTACFGGGEMFVHDAPMEAEPPKEHLLFSFWNSRNVRRDKDYDDYIAEETDTLD